MGITTEKYFENIYNVIFAPRQFFGKEDLAVSVRLAVFTITMVAAVTKITSGVFEGSIINPGFILSLIWSILCCIFLWFITALFFEYISKIFNRNAGLSKILFYTSFAPIPYIFFAPLNLMKNFGNIGYFFGAYCEFFLYFWIIYLYVLALSSVYKITLSRSFMLILLPFIASFFAIYWIIGFFSKIWYIFSI